MSRVLSNLEPKLVWEIFEDICNHPHPSKKEHLLAEYIMDFAKKHNLGAKRDRSGNIIISKPATKGMENKLPVVIQGHIDMVCEKNSDVEFDFDTQPIQPYIDGDWVKAKGTTLGADNGIGVAMGLAVAASNDIPHPDLELLLTLDEETGLTGASNLEKGLLNAKILINLDSEEDGTFCIGCAGGINTEGKFNFNKEKLPEGYKTYQLAIKGLRGGHSGIEIHDGRANSIKLLNRALFNISKNIDIKLTSINGGNKHNAIPREAFAVISINANDEQKLLDLVQEINNIFKNEYLTKEPNLSLSITNHNPAEYVFAKDFQDKLIRTFYSMPHGVIRMSPDIPGLVQTSTNFAIVETKDDHVFILTSQRSSVETEKIDIANTVCSVIYLGNGEFKTSDGYPAWQPNVNSPILNIAKTTYKNLFGKEPKIEAIHAGLECGLIGEKYPGMDMISFGPTLKDVHSPDERVQISTVGNCWKLLLEILKNIPEK